MITDQLGLGAPGVVVPSRPVRIVLSGALDVRAAGETRQRVLSALDLVPASITIDLCDITALDAAGLASVTAPAMTARRAGIPVAFVPPVDPMARRVADNVGVLPLFGHVR